MMLCPLDRHPKGHLIMFGPLEGHPSKPFIIFSTIEALKRPLSRPTSGFQSLKQRRICLYKLFRLLNLNTCYDKRA